MAKWKVNEGTQVFFDGRLYAAGETFDADDAKVGPVAGWVTKVKAAPAADSKAQKPSQNKAQTSSPNKAK